MKTSEASSRDCEIQWKPFGDFSDHFDIVDEEFATFSTRDEALKGIDRLRAIVAERNTHHASSGLDYQEPFNHVVVEQDVYSTWDEMVEALPESIRHLYK